MRHFATDLILLGAWLFAVARVTRLVTSDYITDPLRIWFITHAGKYRAWVAEFVVCPWCVSVWLGFVTSPVPVEVLNVSYLWLPVIALATSYLVGLFAGLDTDDAEIDIEED